METSLSTDLVRKRVLARPCLRLSWSGYALLALALFLIVWVWALATFIVEGPGPNGASFGVDFSHTYAAVLALREGRNPYDYHALSHVQRAILLPLHVPVQPLSRTVLVGTSPFFLWLLQPIAWFGFQVAAVGWIVVTYVLSGFGFLALLSYFGWNRRSVPLAVFLAAPQTLLTAYYGNTASVVFFALACSLPLLRRYPVCAGVFLSAAVLKLPQAAPLVGLIILFEAPHKKRVLTGLLGTYALRKVIVYIVFGQWPLVDYWKGLLSFSHSIDVQPNLVGFSGAYVQLVSPHLRLGLEMTSVVAACVLTLWWAFRNRGRDDHQLLDNAWLWGVWMLATPYAHFDDEMLLVIPIVAVLGWNARNARQPLSLAVLYLFAGSLLLFSAELANMQLLWLPLLAMTICFAGAIRKVPSREGVSSAESSPILLDGTRFQRAWVTESDSRGAAALALQPVSFSIGLRQSPWNSEASAEEPLVLAEKHPL